MNNFKKITLSIGLLALLNGCVIVADGHNRSDWKAKQQQNNQLISNLQLQTERSAVISQLGAPDFSDAFMKAEDEYRILYYRTQHQHSDGETTKDETTPLIFKNNKLIGWGKEVLASINPQI